MTDQEAVALALHHANLGPVVGPTKVSCIVEPFCDGDRGDELIFNFHPATGELMDIIVGPSPLS